MLILTSITSSSGSKNSIILVYAYYGLRFVDSLPKRKIFHLVPGFVGVTNFPQLVLLQDGLVPRL